MNKKKKIAVLGSTGSIGEQTLQVIQNHSSEFEVFSLAACTSIDKLQKQIEKFSPKIVTIYNPDYVEKLKKKNPDLHIISGEKGLIEAVSDKEVDVVVLAMSTMAGLRAAFCAIEEKKHIALANKELLVSAGELFMAKVKQHNATLVPVDSEHSALFQCLLNQKKESIKKVILTASGGPFKNFTQDQLQEITPKKALQHPNWNMGPKITVDSSTMMNKGLEVIEAFWLFDLAIEQIEVVIHPQSIVHSMVEFVDGGVLAQMSKPDMTLPIQYALTYPDRKKSSLPLLDFTKSFQLEFIPPNYQKFPCLGMAFQAIKTKKSVPCFMNAANEVLVDRFLKGEIHWLEIADKLKKLMTSHEEENVLNLNSVFSIDQGARELAKKI